MKRDKPYNFIIPLVIYPFEVMVSIAEDDSVVAAKLKKLGCNTSEEDVSHSDTQRGRTIMFAGNQTLIRMYELRDTPEWKGNLSHEIFHAVDFILSRVGFKLTYESNEAYAYLIGYLTSEIYRRIS